MRKKRGKPDYDYHKMQNNNRKRLAKKSHLNELRKTLGMKNMGAVEVLELHEWLNRMEQESKEKYEQIKPLFLKDKYTTKNL